MIIYGPRIIYTYCGWGIAPPFPVPPRRSPSSHASRPTTGDDPRPNPLPFLSSKPNHPSPSQLCPLIRSGHREVGSHHPSSLRTTSVVELSPVEPAVEPPSPPPLLLFLSLPPIVLSSVSLATESPDMCSIVLGTIVNKRKGWGPICKSEVFGC